MAIFQSKVFLKNGRPPAVVSYAAALEISSKNADPKVPEDTFIELPRGISFRKAQINGVEAIPDAPDTQGNFDAQVRKDRAAELEARKKALANPKRADKTEMFDFMCSILGVVPTPEMHSECRLITRRFFDTHPGRVLVDPALFKPLLSQFWGNKLNLVQSSAYNFLEKAVLRDQYLSTNPKLD